MKVIYVNEANLSLIQQQSTQCAMALGYFDGVHLGHRKVISTAKRLASRHGISSAVLSFFPHPKSVLVPGFEVNYLEPIEQKIEKLEQLGVDIFYIVQFTEELAQLSPANFIAEYVLRLGAREIVCGFDYTFGAKAVGKAHELKYYVPQSIGVTVVEELQWQGNKISSTLIRHFIQASRLHDIPSLLGDYYKTKHCCKNGILPNYAMPQKGSYKVLLEVDGALEETIATVKCPKTVVLSSKASANILTIRWLEKIG